MVLKLGHLFYWFLETRAHAQSISFSVTRPSVAPLHYLWLFLCDCFFFAGWSFSMGSAYQFHSWRVFVVVCALPCVSAVVALTFMPESPRFYLEVGEKPRILILATPFSLLMTVKMTHKGMSIVTAAAHFLLFFCFLFFFLPQIKKMCWHTVWWSANMLVFKVWCGGVKCGKIHDFTTTDLNNNSPDQTSGYTCMSKDKVLHVCGWAFRPCGVSDLKKLLFICQQCTNQNEWLAVLSNKEEVGNDLSLAKAK